MPRSKRCKLPISSERKNSRSFLSKLRSVLSVFRCTGKNSVRVQPTHISVRPATATMDVRDGDRRPKTPSEFFSSSSSRPSTAVRSTTKVGSSYRDWPRSQAHPLAVFQCFSFGNGPEDEAKLHDNVIKFLEDLLRLVIQFVSL